MNSDRVVFGPRRPLKVLALALLAGPVAAGAAFLPEGSRASTSTPSKISNGTIAVIVAGMVLLACLLAYAIAWSLIRKMVIEIDGMTIHAVSRQPKGEWTFDTSQVIEVVRTRDRRNAGGVNLVVRLKPARDDPDGSPRKARLPTAFVGRRNEAERAVVDLIRRTSPDVIIPDRVVWIGQVAWWTALPR